MILLMIDIPLAHAGHWLAGLLYLVPVFVLGVGILWQRRKDRLLRESGEVVDEADVPFTDE
jgi:hypothetical protein